MKKSIMFAIMLMTAFNTNAQLQVNSVGTTLCKKLSSSFYNTSYSSGTLKGISSTLQNIGQMKGEAINGYVFVTSDDNITTRIAIGVRGRADNAFGQNYGIYGECMPIPGNLNYGAGIYGTYKTTPKVLSDNYAGYFDGRVGISEGLIVDGFIRLQGTYLNPSAKGNIFIEETSTTDRSSVSMSNRLNNIKMGTFFIERNEQIYADCGIEDDDKIGTESASPSALQKAVFDRKHYGLNTDQLEEVFPDLVYENEDGTKSINYVEMVPILVQAINELNAKIEELEGNGDSMKKTRAQTTSIDEIGKNVTLLSLGQNKPNPFSTTTDIEVSIPEDVQKAFIYIYDLTGKKLQQVDIPDHGKQSVAINAVNLSDGMYLYSLIADGKVIETRRMIVEK